MYGSVPGSVEYVWICTRICRICMDLYPDPINFYASGGGFVLLEELC